MKVMEHKVNNFEVHNSGTSLAVQWLKLPLPVQGGVSSIPGQGTKILHALWPKNQNIRNRSNIVTHSIKTFKMVHIKKNLLKKCTIQWYSVNSHCATITSI